MDPARTSDTLPLPPARRHRRHTHESSEQPTASLRRIGEALLLAQNRARVSAERANRCERILRTVLSQANLPSAAVLHELQDEYPRSMSLDALSDWDLVNDVTLAIRPSPALPLFSMYSDPAATSTTATVARRSEEEHVTFALSMTHAHGIPHTLATVGRDDDRDDLHTVARAVVLNLHVAARNAKRRISKLEAPVGSCRQVAGRGPVWFAVDGWFIRLVHLEVYGGFRPWQFVTGVVLGVIAGFLGTRRILRRPPAKMAPLIQDKTRRACLADRRDELAKLQLAASRLPVAFAMEDMSYLLPSAVEVTS
ncbi:hypothetical protein P43SY_009474 [Pythium insidiosum]|uniref:Uncharacterized protein n=1 Tax=Pythium insidiosum TaxID=114742 RepID=A0AAD5LX68_PYTIN|nr:hypothetical protein P43SY_009474 [Pythium insidiosum]